MTIAIDPRAAAFIACRLLALYIFYSFVQSLPHFHSTLSSTIFMVTDNPSLTEVPMFSRYWLILTEILADLAPMLFFWFGASWLSARICPTGEEGAGQVAWDHDGVLSLVIAATGLVMVLTGVTHLSQWAYFNLSQSELAYYLADTLLDYAGAIISILFGCLFVLASKAIASFVTRLRYW